MADYLKEGFVTASLDKVGRGADGGSRWRCHVKFSRGGEVSRIGDYYGDGTFIESRKLNRQDDKRDSYVVERFADHFEVTIYQHSGEAIIIKYDINDNGKLDFQSGRFYNNKNEIAIDQLSETMQEAIDSFRNEHITKFAMFRRLAEREFAEREDCDITPSFGR